MSEVFAFLRECKTFFLLTRNGELPAGRPFGAVAEIGGKLYFATSPEKAVYRQLKEGKRVQILAMQPGTRNWMRIDGAAEERRDPSVKAEMLSQCPNLKKHYASPEDPAFAVFSLEEARAEKHFEG